MNTRIHDGRVSAMRYFGGTDRGMCIQIMGAWTPPDAPGAGIFMCGEYDAAVLCAKAIVSFDRAERRRQLDAKEHA